MNFHGLKQYIEIYECKSIKQAAQNLYISSQALSKCLIKLEKELNTKLFLRTHNKLIPTIEGDKLYSHARKLIFDFNSMNLDIQLHNNSSSTLRVASTYGVIDDLSIDFVDSFYKENPDIHLDFFEVVDQQLINMLNSKEINFALVSMPFNHVEYTGSYLFKQKHCILVHKDNPLSKYKLLSYEMIKDEPMAIKGREFNIYNNNINKFFSRNIYPNIYIETSQEQLIYQFVKKNLGIGVILEHQFPNLSEHIKKCYFKDESWYREVALIQRNNEALSEYEIRFINFTKEWCKTRLSD